MNMLLKGFGVVVLIYLLALLYATTQQERLLFHPNTEFLVAGPYEEFFVEDGEITYAGLTNWKDTCTGPVVLYLHGNAGNVYTQTRQYELFEKLGACFFAIDYPGYGKSTGSISKKNDLYVTAEVLLRYVRVQGISDDRLVVRGYSLGGGIASPLALKHDLPHLVLQSTYTRLVDVAAEVYRMFPVRQLISYDLESIETLKTYRGRLTVIHGTSDQTIPYAHGVELFESYMGEKQMVTFDGGHRLDEVERIGEEIEL